MGNCPSSYARHRQSPTDSVTRVSGDSDAGGDKYVTLNEWLVMRLSFPCALRDYFRGVRNLSNALVAGSFGKPSSSFKRL